MPRLINKHPKYRKHKASGRAVVTINGKDVYLGDYGSKASRDEYNKVIAQWIGSDRTAPARVPSEGITVVRLVADFWRHARSYYRDADGRVTEEAINYRDATRPLLKLYKRDPAADFGPLALKAVRAEMIRMGWARTHINRQVLRVKHVFRWATENELIPANVYHGLVAVAGLKAGRSEAKESEPVRPVPEATVDATLVYLPPAIADMVRVQLLTGMRPGEVCGMRGCDLETTGNVWRYTPAQHKTQHHGHKRVIDLGPRAQEILKQYLKPDLQAHLFTPADSERQRHARQRQDRETPLTPSQEQRAARAARRRRRRAPGGCYDVATFRRAIARACAKAFQMPAEYRDPAPGTKAAEQDTAEARKQRRAKRREWNRQHIWHPHQLRHTAATKLRREYGLEAARIILGHKTTPMTELYAEQDRAEAMRIMAQIG